MNMAEQKELVDSIGTLVDYVYRQDDTGDPAPDEVRQAASIAGKFWGRHGGPSQRKEQLR